MTNGSFHGHDSDQMLVLGLDTTTRAGSCALVRDGRLLGSFAGDPSRTHAERLPGDLVHLLDRHDMTPAMVDVFAVAAGPGSFTGLRVGIAAVQGLAFALGRPVVPVSALDVLACIAAGWDGMTVPDPIPSGGLAAAVMDAQRQEVFSGLYRRSWPADSGGDRPGGSATPPGGNLAGERGPWLVRLEIVDQPAAEPPETVFARWARVAAADRSGGRSDGIIRLAGDGALRYRAGIERWLGPDAGICDPLPPLAPLLTLLAARRAAEGGAVSPHAIRPIYIRRSDAELARDRRQPGGAERST